MYKKFFSIKKKNTKRIWEIDFIRGFCVVLMIIDHFFIILGQNFILKWGETLKSQSFLNFAEIVSKYTTHNWYIILKMMTIGAFLFVSGLSTNFSKKYLNRTIKIVIFSIILTLVSLLIFPLLNISPIKFGIINMFATTAIVIYIGKIITKNNQNYWILYVVLISLLSLIFNIIFILNSNRISDNVKNVFFMFSSGLSNQTDYTDYAPLFLYMPVILIGTLFSNFYKERESLYKSLDLKIFKPINFLGRNALIVYVVHIIIIYLILFIITCFIKLKK